MKVLKFGAVWCAGCVVMKPRWKELEEKYPWLETRYYEYDDSQEEVAKWNIGENLPVFIFVDKNDNEITRLTGEVPKETLEELIEKYKNM